MKRFSLFRRRHTASTTPDAVTVQRTHFDSSDPDDATRVAFHRDTWLQNRRADPYAAYTDPGEGRSFFHDVVMPGTVAGFVGGLVMLLMYMLIGRAMGQEWLALPKAESSFFFPYARDFTGFGLGTALIGLVLHFAIACGVGVTFSLLVPRREVTMFSLAPLALFFSLVSYVVLVMFVAEWAAELVRVKLLHPVLILSTFGYAMSLLLIQPLRRRMHWGPVWRVRRTTYA